MIISMVYLLLMGMRNNDMTLVYQTPKNYREHNHLFEIVINNLQYSGRINEYLSHGQIANLVFDSGDTISQSYLSLVTNHYSDYMIRHGGKYRFDHDRIKQDFPSFFKKEIKESNILKEIKLAIKHEKSASFRNRIGKIVYISDIEQLGETEQFYFYNIYLKLDSDETLKIYEGMNIKLAFDKKRYIVTALDINEIDGKLIIRSAEYLINTFKKSKRNRLVIDSVWLLQKLEDAITNFPEEQHPISKLLEKKWVPETIELCDCFYRGVLDESQQNTIKKCLTHDLTAIWGPPGTGKTTTLAYLLQELFKRNEKTLVCSIANVAVDSILKTCLSKFEEFERQVKPIKYRNGIILRIGFSNDPAIKENRDIQVDSKEVRSINYQLKKIKTQLLKDDIPEDAMATLKSDRLDLLEKMEREKKRLINKSKLIFATASKIEVDSLLSNLDVDNIIIDEASMMSAPHLLAIAKNTKKRIIIAGDFRQLGPIAIAQSELAYKWLHNDLFDFFGIKHKQEESLDHPALAMIVNQRRFHDSICQLINPQFYDYKLITKTEINQLKLFKQKPEKEKTIVYYNMRDYPEYNVLRTKEQSRYNLGSLNYVIDKILKPLLNHPLRTPFSIAIITPYKGQVNQYNLVLPQAIKNKDYIDRIQIGTVHSFQGSQADLLIFDMVDSNDEKIGRLFWQNTGERLINVAISRATGKLIFVGDITAICEGKGYMNISRKVISVLKKIESYVVN